MAPPEQNKPHGITKLLALFLPICVLPFSSLIFIFSFSYPNPIIADLTSDAMSIATLDPKSPEYASIQSCIMKDLGELAGMEGVIITVTFIVSSLFTIAPLCSFLVMLNGPEKLPASIDVLFTFTIGRGLEGYTFSTLNVKLFSLGYFFLLIEIFGIFALVADGWMTLIASGVVLILLCLAWYLYLTTVWSVSVAISDAISMAVKNIRGGIRRATVLALIGFLMIAISYAAYHAVKAYVLPSTMSQIGSLVYFAKFGALEPVLHWAMMKVFKLCDRSQINGGEGAMGIDAGGSEYGSLPTADHDDHQP